MEHEQFLVLQLGQFATYATKLIYNRSIRNLYVQKCNKPYCYYLLQLTVNIMSTIFDRALYGVEDRTALHRSEMQFLIVSLFTMSFYTTSQIRMQCLSV